MMKSASNLHRSMGSRASLVSMSTTSSMSALSSTSNGSSTFSSPAFGDRSVTSSSIGLSRRCSSSSVNLVSLLQQTNEGRNLSGPNLSGRDKHNLEDQTSSEDRPEHENHNWWFSPAVFFSFLIHLIFPETSSLLDYIKAMILNYRDEYILKQDFAFVLASSISMSSMGQELYGKHLVGGNATSSSMTETTATSREISSSMIFSPSSEDIYPRAKLIVRSSQNEEDGHGCGDLYIDDPSDQWGHFADFDYVDDKDILLISSSSRFKLNTLNEHEEEDEE